MGSDCQVQAGTTGPSGGPRASRRGCPGVRALRFLRHNLLFSVSLVLLAVSAGFFWGAERFRRSIKQRESVAFATGDKVKIIKAIDGDEVVVVGKSGHQTVVRLLGIKSFDPSRNDPLMNQYGVICFDTLKGQFVGRDALVTVGKTKVDKYDRLLAYLEVQRPGADAYTEDIGLVLVRRGLTLVYTRYDFSRMADYAKAEIEAMDRRAGLWANDKVAARAQALKAMWVEEKERDD